MSSVARGVSRENVSGAHRARSVPPKMAWAAILAGVVALTAALAAACGSTPPPSVGGPAASKLAGATPSATGSGVPIRSGELPSAGAGVRPTQLRIGRIGLTARVDAVGLDAGTGDFAVPPSVDLVGWYRFGPDLSATAGSIVVAGHVDSAQQGKGAFFRLRELAPGDRIAVTGSDGRVRSFSVVAREIYAKTSISLDKYFARDGAVRLTLITCGGPFDSSTRHYRDNVVITAQPVAG